MDLKTSFLKQKYIGWMIFDFREDKQLTDQASRVGSCVFSESVWIRLGYVPGFGEIIVVSRVSLGNQIGAKVIEPNQVTKPNQSLERRRGWY